MNYLTLGDLVKEYPNGVQIREFSGNLHLVLPNGDLIGELQGIHFSNVWKKHGSPEAWAAKKQKERIAAVQRVVTRLTKDLQNTQARLSYIKSFKL